MEGWTTIALPDGFDQTSLTDAATDGSRTVVVGCERTRNLSSATSLWWSDDLRAWTEVPASSGAPCLYQVEHTTFGWFAVGPGGTLWSPDGSEWRVLELWTTLGLELQGQLGWAQAIFSSPGWNRVTLLYSRASFAESTIATLLTTTDGESWVEGPADSASLFDNTDVRAVIPGADGLLAVGASPGGEFVPTAAAFTSVDGLEWRRVTPGGRDFDDARMNAVIGTPDGFVAVGGDFFQTGLMTAWTSPDGIAWTRAPHPDEATDPSVAFMTAEAVTIAPDGTIWAAGVDHDARRSRESLPALWRSVDGWTWERVPLEDGTIVPFDLLDDPDGGLGSWPPPFGRIVGPRYLFLED